MAVIMKGQGEQFREAIMTRLENLDVPFSEAIIIDTPVKHRDGFTWSHMTGNNVDDLKRFAKRIGLRPEWFQDKPGHPHFDIHSNMIRSVAVKYGAVMVCRVYYLHYVKWIHK